MGNGPNIFSYFISRGLFLPERDYVTFGCSLSQIRLLSVCCKFVTFVRLTHGIETFGNTFGILYLSHPLTSVQNVTKIVPGKPLRRGR